jgi:hypothetical protein
VTSLCPFTYISACTCHIHLICLGMITLIWDVFFRTVSICLALVIECQKPPNHAAYNATLAQCWAGAHQSSRGKKHAILSGAKSTNHKVPHIIVSILLSLSPSFKTCCFHNWQETQSVKHTTLSSNNVHRTYTLSLIMVLTEQKRAGNVEQVRHIS